MPKASITETWNNLTPFGRLLIGFISLVLISCTAFSGISTVLILLLPVPTQTPQVTPTFTLSPSPEIDPNFTPLPSPSLTPLATRRAYASQTPSIYLITPTNTFVPFVFPSATPTFTRIPRNKSVCTCSYDRYACEDFTKQIRAQACFNFCFSLGKGDIHKLDEDHDGLACNGLP
jgi:hypothetical protein